MYAESHELSIAAYRKSYCGLHIIMDRTACLGSQFLCATSIISMRIHTYRGVLIQEFAGSLQQNLV